MREIKFRGKRVDNGEWVFGNLFREAYSDASNIMGFDYYNSPEGLQRDPFDYVVHPNTVGQYTGLKDKNDKEIYEGDILQEADDYARDYYHAVVKWHDEQGYWYIGFLYEYQEDTESLCEVNKYCEIIGNVHDNPELIER